MKHTATAIAVIVACSFATVRNCHAEWRGSGPAANLTIRSSIDFPAEHIPSQPPAGLTSTGLTIGSESIGSAGVISLQETDSQPPMPLVLFRAWNFSRFTGPLGMIRFKFYNFRHPFWPMGRALICHRSGNCPHLPEPSSMVLAGIGGLIVGAAALRRRLNASTKETPT
jgi:hypothetical protein